MQLKCNLSEFFCSLEKLHRRVAICWCIFPFVCLGQPCFYPLLSPLPDFPKETQPTWEMWLTDDSMRRSWDAWMSSSCSTLLARALIWYATLASDWVVYALVSSKAFFLSWAWGWKDRQTYRKRDDDENEIYMSTHTRTHSRVYSTPIISRGLKQTWNQDQNQQMVPLWLKV